MKISLFMIAVAGMWTVCGGATVPEVSGVTMAQAASSRLVTITYTLKNAPAVITVDIETNATDGTWTSIGGAAVCNAAGDVWKKVGTADQTFSGTITWRPDLSWPDHVVKEGGARARVTAWALSNTPDYMVVDLSSDAQPGTQTYYPAVDFLPGGLLANPAYRTTMLVMRKIMSKGVTWTRGSTKLEENRSTIAYREDTFQVTLNANYYIGVFEFTQAQWALINTDNPTPCNFSNSAYRAMRPVEKVSYNQIRTSDNQTAVEAYLYPAAPNPVSLLGRLRTKTGIDFDLPSESQWEFAARAGNGDTKWGDGSGIQDLACDTNLDRLARYKGNGGYIDGTTRPDAACDLSHGTAAVGTYEANDWGLYDMSGNVYEWCLDWDKDDVRALKGAVNTVKSNMNADGKYLKVLRGGAWSEDATRARPAYRSSNPPDIIGFTSCGFRVVCTAGLE